MKAAAHGIISIVYYWEVATLNWRKIGLLACVCVLLMSACGYGVYRLLVNRYSAEIDSILTDILSDDAILPPANSSAATPESTQANPGPPAGPSPSSSAVGTAPDSGPSQESSESDEGQSQEEGDAPSGADDVTEGLTLTAEEQHKAESADEILEQMSTSEKLMVLKTLNRFSTSELLEMYRIYSGGDAEAIAELKKTIKAKFSAEDIELIKQMAAKYR